MRVDPEEIRRRFASIDDEELLDTNRDELSELAQKIFDEECERRGIETGAALDEQDWEDGGEEDEEGIEGGVEIAEDSELGDEDRPEWMDDGVCVCTFETTPGSPAVADVVKARSVLLAAEIPCTMSVVEMESKREGHPPSKEVSLFVPGPVHLHAMAVLDRDLFNETHEEEWQRHFEAISDEDLQALDPALFTAGLLDRVARMKRVYAGELKRRGLSA